MEDRRCKLGLQGRLELVRLIEQGSTLRAAAAALSVAPATAHRWWHRWAAATAGERVSLACLRTRSSRPHSCPGAFGVPDGRAVLDARAGTKWGPNGFARVSGRPPSPIWEGLKGPGLR